MLAVATRYVLAVGGEADEEEFADAAVLPSWRSGRYHRPPPAGRRREGTAAAVVVRRREGDRHRQAAVAADRGDTSRVPRWRRTGTKYCLVNVFRQGLAVLLSRMIAGHALPKPFWKPEAWLEIRCEIKPPPQQPPILLLKNPSL